ncbi:hypothetical protein ACJ41O_003896 [Fusarium nematophilum]
MSESQSVFQVVPLELWQSILAYLPDVPSLASAALSCRSLYTAFKSREHGLVQSVLVNCIGVANLPEALITQRCSPPLLSIHVERQNLPTGDEQMRQMREYVFNFVTHLERPSLGSAEISLAEGLALGDFHVQTVSPLTQSFVEACSKRSGWQRPLEESLQTRPLSRTERERIERALYRFEMFRRLFGCFGEEIDELLNFATTFFSKFAPWESAQLGCIHDFLARELLPAFNDVAEHDVVWGEHSVLLAEFDDNQIQHLLTLGLDRILEISSSITYEDREKLLRVREMPPEENGTFLQCSLEATLDLDVDEDTGRMILEATPFFSDGDGGAEEIWKLTTLDSDLGIYDHRDLSLRQWGYVLWDDERLQPLRCLLPPWTAIADLPQDHGSLGTVTEAVRESWEARSSLYRRGARGFWSKDDESRLVWPHLRKDQASEALKRPPGSLAEAKDMWRTRFVGPHEGTE